MKYGCIGEHLKHSFSKEIHNALADYEYEIKEIPKSELDAFMTSHDFFAINVTIPYKQAVIPYLYFIDEYAKEIGAVNTIVNRDGKLYGYNTDFYGMSMLIKHAAIELKNKKVAILGTGGTSKTARAVAKSLFAREILVVSRTKNEDNITYEELYNYHTDIDVIINTTPVGMYPNIYDEAADLSKFTNLSGVIDAVYNPLRTEMINRAKNKDIASEGGLYMLVAQGVRASEIFIDTKYDDETLEKVYQNLKCQKENIVLIGMPASGKSTVGKLLAEKLNRTFIDTDVLIEEKENKTIKEIFATMGEPYFRKIESEIVKEISHKTGIIIATGGGVPLNNKNTEALLLNGKIYFIDRPLESLIPTEDRPLSSSKETIAKRYNERYNIYRTSADVIIDADCNADAVAAKIEENFNQ